MHVQTHVTIGFVSIVCSALYWVLWRIKRSEGKVSPLKIQLTILAMYSYIIACFISVIIILIYFNTMNTFKQICYGKIVCGDNSQDNCT